MELKDKKCEGRPRKSPPADVLDVIEASCALGASSKQALAMATGVCRDVFERWMAETPAIQEAVRTGTEKERQILHSVLYKKATEDGGKDSMIASMFLLKSRHGYQEGQQEASPNRVTINFTLPGAMTREAFTIENNDPSPATNKLSTKSLVRS